MPPTAVVAIGTAPLDVTCNALGVSIHHGRDDPTNQPEASTAVVDLYGPLPAEAIVGARLVVRANLGGTLYDRFSGTISDLDVSWDTPDDVVPRIIAVGDLARLGRSEIGDVPWPAELDGARVNRILTLAGYTPPPALTDPGQVGVLARDVDRQPALTVAQEAALDGGGVLWQDRSGRILYADSEHRRGTVTAMQFEACDIGAGAGWTKSPEGLVNDVWVRYGIVPADGSPQAELESTDPVSVAARGTFESTISTRIADATQARKRADGIIARQADPAWVFGGLELELAMFDDATVAAILGLDVHALVRVTGLPAGSPATTVDLWVEGWKEDIRPTGPGVLSWDLKLATSDYCRTAAYGRWNDVDPGLTWNAVDPATRWNDISCLPVPPSAAHWDDVAASLRWNQVDPATTWNTWKG